MGYRIEARCVDPVRSHEAGNNGGGTASREAVPHGQDDVAVLAAHIQVPQGIVGDAPDEVCDPI
jgi:hypothetical protein